MPDLDAQPGQGAHNEINPRGTAAGEAPGDEILFSGGVRSYLIAPLIARDQSIGAGGAVADLSRTRSRWKAPLPRSHLEPDVALDAGVG